MQIKPQHDFEKMNGLGYQNPDKWEMHERKLAK